MGAHPGRRQTLTRHMESMPTVATFVLAGFSSPPLREVCAFQDEQNEYTSSWRTYQVPEAFPEFCGPMVLEMELFEGRISPKGGWLSSPWISPDLILAAGQV